MKKTLAALAVLSLFAGAASAADVTLYGRIDMMRRARENERQIAQTRMPFA